MSPFPAPRPLLLEPLEDFPLVVPFPERHLLPSGPGVLGLFNETPSTIDLSLPTPNIPILTMFDDDPPPATQAHYDTDMPQAEIIQPPPAPVIKDMDSFSEGTAQGSFDFSMCSDNGDAPALQPSVAFSPDHPTLSIEVWRDDVDRSTVVDREERRTRSDDRGRIFEVRFLHLT
ncbi:hypothetical protein BC834DRAFT_141109 [Gloeopeniophorella convolvens]|nr:hypothetical protein BC834DRAFT_141109 [Gloeopeniophorella convolvens]